jgi:hypothetical protein
MWDAADSERRLGVKRARGTNNLREEKQGLPKKKEE